jgi:hypothetical protein
MYTHKNAQVVTGLETSCYNSVRKFLFALLVPSCWNNLEQAVVTSLMALSDMLQGCSNKSDTVMI